MNIHEYQAKELYRKYGIPVPKGVPCMSVEEATAAAQKLIEETGNEVVVVKAQIHAGGRGKGTVKSDPQQHGVQLVKSADEARNVASKLLAELGEQFDDEIADGAPLGVAGLRVLDDEFGPERLRWHCWSGWAPGWLTFPETYSSLCLCLLSVYEPR